ncbi:hypothetical protein L3049_19550 [Labilibaculum sp. DW002]|uniref:Bacteriocin n=1 Tax=Paralabilibaculum antarcticum TaxID=2912572 RepID=A0ABT5VZD6_9BACT|nr:hypothetical protein [Labilibaculum sp. DW002]MDE5420192.1 hypothetical protein [Labilibaculum sp. DW002]
MSIEIKINSLSDLSCSQLEGVNGGSEFTDWILETMGWMAAFRADQRAYESEFSYLYAHME